jgi:hypothetical protein
MRGFREAALAATLVVAACAPTRVDIREQPAGGYAAVAFGEDEATCAEARTRVKDEARFHCEVRGQRASLGQMISEGVPQGCRVELPFWCTTSGL